jgi:GTP-binding protein Era
MKKRCGTIAVLGRPNVGKSTLINRLARSRLSITSPRPQTTRVALRAVITLDDCQLVIIDTPGFNVERSLLDSRMRRAILGAVLESDLVVAMTEITRGQIESGRAAAGSLRLHPADRSLFDEIAREGRAIDILLINKIDKVRDRRFLLPLMDLYRKTFGMERIFLVSAKRGEGTGDFLDHVRQAVPEGDFIFDPEQLSDRPERFFIAEFIREQIFAHTSLEVPYASSVTVESWEEEEAIVRIEARIHVEKSGQKGILVGKKGAMIKKIGTAARKEIETFLGKHVYLGLAVDVKEGWREDIRSVDSMIEGR